MSIVEEPLIRLPPSPEHSHARCPVCSSSHTEDFFHLRRLPLHVGMVYATADQARQAAVGQVTLTWCSGCGFVFNRSFEADKLIFAPGYEVQLIHSPVFSKFLAELAARLIQRYGLHGKDLIDIGCGAGHFLRMLCEGGDNRGIGIDPTVTREGPVKLTRGEMRLLRGVFSEHEAVALDCDFASCQSVLEDVPDPVSFLSNVRRVLKARSGHAYLEVFNAHRAFSAGEVWSLTYEQCNYYSLDSLSAAIRRAGFRIVDAGTCYGDGQYLYVEATPSDDPPLEQEVACEGIERPSAIARFAQVHTERLIAWRARLESFRRQKTRVVVWGSGGKGVCFLNTVGAEDVFRHVVDINPDRQRRHMPGTGQRIIGPGDLQNLRPDTVVITNPLYEAEIRRTVSELNLNCEFLTI
jgi:SAM-dependent methyltransferase